MEKDDLKMAFQKLDLNGDGFLSLEELKVGYETIFEHQKTEEEIEEIFKKIDTDCNGVIDYSEFIAASIDQQKMLADVRIEKVFEIFDQDHTGSISAQNLEKMFSGHSSGGKVVSKKVWE